MPTSRHQSILGTLTIVAASLLHDTACTPNVHAHGPLSHRALVLVGELKGRGVRLAGLGPPDRAVFVKDFYVGSNPLTGHGPVVVLATDEALAKPVPHNAPQGADGFWYLPLVTDGDAAHLIRHAIGDAPADLSGLLSGLYARTAGVN